MNDLHLFAGIGGGILGSMLCGHRIVCAVELDPYCRSVLVQRQNDGLLPPFPIWDDVRTFNGRVWRGIVDVVSGGFPCQNISSAGDRTGITGDKSSLWFEMLRIVREVRPQFVFVENSSQLIRRGLDTILKGLDKSGYDAEWCVLGADDVGAPHIRKRCWVLGKSTHSSKQPLAGYQYKAHESGWLHPAVSHTDGARRKEPNQSKSVPAAVTLAGSICTQIPDTNRHSEKAAEVAHTGHTWRRTVNEVNQRNHSSGERTSYSDTIGRSSWWEVEPRLDRVAHGVSRRVERIKGLGNAQVPLCAAVAWTTLYKRINKQGDEP